MEFMIAETESHRSDDEAISSPIRLSLCMIVRDGARWLARCLSSVADLVDELVIVDTGSRDATMRIAAGFGAQIHQLAWPGDFALARNYAIDQAHGDWILMLDADEYLDERARDRLRGFRAQPPPAGRYSFRIHNPDPAAGSGRIYYMDRLFPRRPSIRYVAPLHEFLVDTAPEPLPLAVLPDFEVQHSGLLPSETDQLAKLERNRAILEAALQRWPDDSHCRYHLAGVYRAQGQPEQAIVHYQRLLAGFQQLPDTGHSFFALAIAEMAGCLAELGRVDEALSLTAAAEPACEHHPGYWLQRGRLLRSRNRFDEAADCFRRCLAIDEQTLQMAYDPASLMLQPSLQLLQLNRLIFAPRASAPQVRQTIHDELEAILLRLLQLAPAGELSGPTHNLHILLAETLLDLPDPAQAYVDLLPDPVREQSVVAVIAVILIWLSSSDKTEFLEQNPYFAADSLMDPNGSILDPSMNSPFFADALLPVADRLWQQGQRLPAWALLHLGMRKFARPDWAAHLAELLDQMGQAAASRQIRLEAQLLLPG